jgi:hypothetical protein
MGSARSSPESEGLRLLLTRGVRLLSFLGHSFNLNINTDRLHVFLFCIAFLRSARKRLFPRVGFAMGVDADAFAMTISFSVDVRASQEWDGIGCKFTF